LLFAKKQVTLLHELLPSSSSSSLPRSVGGASGFWYAQWVVLNVLSAAACGGGPDISIIAVSAAYFHVFFPELVLELLVLSLCKSALKTKESIKAQNKRNPSNPLKIFFF